MTLGASHPSVLRTGVAAHVAGDRSPGYRLVHLVGMALQVVGWLSHHPHGSVSSHVIRDAAPGLWSCHAWSSHLWSSHPILPELVVHLWLVLLHAVVQLLAPWHGWSEGRLLGV